MPAYKSVEVTVTRRNITRVDVPIEWDDAAVEAAVLADIGVWEANLDDPVVDVDWPEDRTVGQGYRADGTYGATG